MPPSSLAAALAASKTAPSKQPSSSPAQFAKSKSDTQQPEQPGQDDSGRSPNAAQEKSSLQRNARHTGGEKGGGKHAVVPAEKDEPTPGQANKSKKKHRSRRNRKGKAKSQSPKREANEGDQSEIVFLCDFPSDDSSDASSEKQNPKQTPRQQKRGARNVGREKGQRDRKDGNDGCCPNPVEGHGRHERRRGGQIDREGQSDQRKDNRNRKDRDSGNVASTPTRATLPKTPWSNKATSARNGVQTSDRSRRSRASEDPGRGRFENIRDTNAHLNSPQRNEGVAADVQIPVRLEAATIKGRWADEDSSDDD